MAEETTEEKPQTINPDVLNLIIINPDKIVYEAEITKAMLPTKLGIIAALPQHTPLYSELVEGTIIITEKAGKTHEEKIDGGVARVKDNRLKILIGF